ncbi:MAG: hypothetical protein IJV96_05930 [Clostridia bacterium]|nr:hypothetical protein [Clostridia bacterium]
MSDATKQKKIFSTELAYLFALLALAVGTALMEASDFGVSMVVAPAYLLHLKLSEFFPFFSFGMAEYCLQAVLVLIVAIVVRRFKLSYLFSFVTAVLYGLALDGCIALVGFIPVDTIAMRLVFYLLGIPLCSLGVSLFFHTYISPEAYELFVKELSTHMGVNIHKFKTIYDCVCCALSILLSFAFFGLWHFEGVKLGTVVCALINGFVISTFTRILERRFRFEDKLPLRPLFER